MKRILDILLCCMALIISWPVFIVVAILIYLEDKKEIFFYQKRIGRNGVVFEIIKFRSMVIGAEKSGTGLYSYKYDDRLTRTGKFIRKFSIDELPQIFNVLRGEMSLVGPRPPVTYELGPWEEYNSDMLKRFEVKPGITGLAQISGRNDNNWDVKIRYDNEYVDDYRKYGIIMDLVILLRTIVVVFGARGVIEDLDNLEEGPISLKARLAAEKYLNNG